MGKHSTDSLSLTETLDKYAKFLVALGGALGATTAQIAVQGTPQTFGEWLTIAIYFVTAVAVRQVPNKEKNVL